MKKNYVVILLVTLVVSQLAVSMLIVSLSQRGQKERAKNREVALQIKQESLSLKCLLLIPNTQRNQGNIARCDAQAKALVDKQRNE